MRFGFFNDDNREYVITRPDTPLPWTNYLGCESYFGIISNTAGGYSFYRDARFRRLTRYRYNNVPLDMGGRYIYVRDDVSEDVWSPSWMPVRRPVEEYTCRHGLGYTVIGARRDGIAAETTCFVPLDEDLEVWSLVVTNTRATPADLSVFASIEFCLWDAWDDATNFQRNLNVGEVEVESGVIYHVTGYRERRNHFAYFACSEPTVGFDTQREAFLGPYRGWDDPVAVATGACTDSIAHGWAPIGAHHLRLRLGPGESRRVIFVLGYHENPVDDKFDPPGSQRLNKRTVLPVIAQYSAPGCVDAALAELNRYWDGLLSGFQVSTPSSDTNRMVNIWNAYQCMVTLNLSRSASYFESGIGRGIGFRDSAQDLLGFMHMAPERARGRLLDLAATQLPSGGAYHQYQPLTKLGNDAIGGGFNDDPLWLVLAAAAYLKETGDWSLLAEPVPYDSRPETEAAFFDHLQRALAYTVDRLGPHGLPLIGRADWNDCLNLNCFSEQPDEAFQIASNRTGDSAESVFIAGLFVLAAREMITLVEHWPDADGAKKTTLVDSYRAVVARMVAAIDAHGWDGAWFLRAYDYFGEKVGSAECDEGRIFIEPQGLCIMAGLGLDDGRAAQALVSVRERLATAHGVVLVQPAYSRYYLNLGEISSYPPGYKENASIFCHTNPWIMIAEALVGNGDAAHDYYLRINPSAREAISDLHRCEPYVYAQTIAGRDAATPGEAKNSWLTGTAAWNLVAITQWILGIRPTYDGLAVAPVIPPGWAGFEATRVFRGVVYRLDVRRAGPGNRVSLTVDGCAVEGNVVPPPPTGALERHVQVTIS